MEEPLDGYTTIYTDAGGQEIDRAYSGCTITNSKIPATGDHAPLMLWAAMLTASVALLFMLNRCTRKN